MDSFFLFSVAFLGFPKLVCERSQEEQTKGFRTVKLAYVFNFTVPFFLFVWISAQKMNVDKYRARENGPQSNPGTDHVYLYKYHRILRKQTKQM